MQLTGIIVSDLGQAASFMTLDWVQASLERCLGFSPFPATLNVRPKAAEDLETWRRVQEECAALPLPPIDGSFCRAKIFRATVWIAGNQKLKAAVLLPEVKNYPEDKIEIVAPVRVKDHWRVGDGDALTLEFIH